MKSLLKLSGLLLLIFIAVGVIPASQGLYGIFWKRYTTSLMGNPLYPAFSWYTPKEIVSGSTPQALERLNNSENPFTPETILKASNYAEQHGSDSLTVLYQGKIAIASYWNDTSGDSLFATHSLMKTIPALLMGNAIRDGFIQSIDEPAANYLPEWQDDIHKAINIRHLLTMSSGMKESYDFRPSSDRSQRFMGTDIISANLNINIADKPDTFFSHVNSNSQLLGVIVERASQQRFGDYLAKELWQPLGLNDAYLYVDREGGMAHTDCCMWAKINDWVKIGELLRNKGRYNDKQIIAEGWVDQMITPSKVYANYGMQLWLGREYQEWRKYDHYRDSFANFHSEAYVARDIFYLDGLGKVRLYILPSEELVILRTGPNSDDWDDSFLPNLLARSIHQRLSGIGNSTKPSVASSKPR